MTEGTADVVRDPLFQLNALLWMVSPLPDEGPTAPVLFKAGFTLHAMSPPLAVPGPVLLRARDKKLEVKGNVAPDMVLKNETKGRYVFVECKGNSFGPEADECRQARALLLVSRKGVAEEALGLASGQMQASEASYLVPHDRRKPMATTLTSLCASLADAGLPGCTPFVCGLDRAKGGVYFTVDRGGAEFLGLKGTRHLFNACDEDTDPRPLYLVPFDPDVDVDAYGRRVLVHRMHVVPVTRVGRANPPCKIELKTDEILSEATFGFYEKWESRDARRYLKKLCRAAMKPIKEAVNKAIPNSMAYLPGSGWDLDLRSVSDREKALKAIEKVTYGDSALEIGEQTELFDGEDTE